MRIWSSVTLVGREGERGRQDTYTQSYTNRVRQNSNSYCGSMDHPQIANQTVSSSPSPLHPTLNEKRFAPVTLRWKKALMFWTDSCDNKYIFVEEVKEEIRLGRNSGGDRRDVFSVLVRANEDVNEKYPLADDELVRQTLYQSFISSPLVDWRCIRDLISWPW